jgi:glutathione S-transferase
LPENTYIIYGAPHSFFTGKALIYLRYKRIPFAFRMSSLKVYKKIILPRTGVAFIPVVMTPDDEALQDTTHIIDTLEQRFPERPIYPEGPLQRLVALLLEVFGDDWLVLPAMHYRWNFMAENRRSLLHHFGDATLPGWPRPIKNIVAGKVWKRFSGHVPKMGVTERTIPALEVAFLELIANLETHFTEHAFLLGDRPSLADFGLIGGFSAHLNLDPYPRKILAEKAPRLVAWIERMEQAPDGSGNLLPDDRIPETLIPVLKQMFTLQAPFLRATAERLRDWLKDNPDKHVPRSLGRLPYTIGDVTEEKATLPYNQWMWQRPHDQYKSLEGKDKARADALMESIGGSAFMNDWPEVRLEKRDNKLVSVA